MRLHTIHLPQTSVFQSLYPYNILEAAEDAIIEKKKY
jgi:hypothetical protein